MCRTFGTLVRDHALGEQRRTVDSNVCSIYNDPGALKIVNRNTAADVVVGFAHDGSGHGIAYAAIANGSGRGVMRVPFCASRWRSTKAASTATPRSPRSVPNSSAADTRESASALADERIVRDLAAPAIVPPALGMPYVKARCALNGFVTARVERADPREIADLEGRARAELQLRTAA